MPDPLELDPPGDRPSAVLHYCDNLPAILPLRMKQLADIHRWLTGHFHALVIMLQLPGGSAYKWNEQDHPDFSKHIWTRNPRDAHTLLAAALERLQSAHLLQQLSGKARRLSLPSALQQRVDSLARHQLLALAAECLDRLLVVPHLPDEASAYDIDKPSKSPNRRPRPKKGARKTAHRN